ncbi:MAG: AraC family transcriptional regulator [Rhodothermales bacterium]
MMLVWTVLLSFGALHGIFLAAALQFRPASEPTSRSRSARPFLTVLLLALSLMIAEAVYAMHGGWLRTPGLAFASAPLWFAVAPLLYLFVDRRTSDPTDERRVHPPREWMWHFSAAVAVPAFLVVPFWILPAGDQLDFIAATPRGWRFVLFHSAVIVQWLVYLFLAWRKTRRCTHPGVIRGLLLGMMIYVVAAGPAYLLPETWLGRWLGQVDYIFILAFLIHGVAWTAVRTPQALFESPNRKRKYQHSGLSDADAQALVERLDGIMHDEELFKDPALTLDRLAATVHASSHHVSQCLNQIRGDNFYAYVNRFRAEEAARRLQDPAHDHLTVLAIAEESGFNSKASFNRAFRAATGMSPSEYKARRGA